MKKLILLMIPFLFIVSTPEAEALFGKIKEARRCKKYGKRLKRAQGKMESSKEQMEKAQEEMEIAFDEITAKQEELEMEVDKVEETETEGEEEEQQIVRQLEKDLKKIKLDLLVTLDIARKKAKAFLLQYENFIGDYEGVKNATDKFRHKCKKAKISDDRIASMENTLISLRKQAEKMSSGVLEKDINSFEEKLDEHIRKLKKIFKPNEETVGLLKTYPI